MNNNISFSLSLRKRLENRRVNLDSEIDNVFKILGIRSLLHKCNIKKTKGTWDSSNTLSVHFDMAFHTSKNRPNTRMRDIDKRTNGWLRRKESLRKRTDVVVEMINRAWQNNIDASFVLFDSWFSHDAVIAKIFDIGYGVICRLKQGRVKYTYKGKKYTLKQLWPIVKKQTQWIGKFRVKAVCVNVSLPKSGDVRILFVSDGKKQWHAFLSIDLELEPSEILTYYARRWAIEVFFKDAKHMLYMGKEQSNTFDVLVASYNMVLVRYLMLVFILNRNNLQGPIGPLFKTRIITYISV